MTIHRFNWDSWDVVVTSISGNEGDLYRTDYTYACASETPGTSAASPVTPPITAGLVGCQIFMPPRIDEIRIIPSSLIQVYIYGDGIRN